jgi:HAD superfamily hydrolase (TIGR01549 family)
MSYDAVLFGNDGVLTHLTPTDVWRRAIRDAFDAFGVDPTTEGVDGVMHGSAAHVASVCELHDLDHATFWDHHERHLARAQRAAMASGEKPLYADVAAITELPVPLGVVSNNQHETVEGVIDVFGLEGVFDVVSGRDSSVEGYRRRKPDPHYIERALDDLGVDSALYVGDSNVDVVAADRAGLDAAFVRRPHRADYELAADPTYELGSLDEVVSLVGTDSRATV